MEFAELGVGRSRRRAAGGPCDYYDVGGTFFILIPVELIDHVIGRDAAGYDAAD